MLVLIIWFATMIALAPIAEVIQQAIGLSFEVFALITLVPAVAATIVLLIGPSWLPTVWSRGRVGAVIISTSAGLAGVAAFALTAALILGRLPSLPSHLAGLPIVLFIAIQGIGVVTEEIGWRGFAQRCGEHLMPPAVFSALAGFVFGITHVGYWSHGPIAVLTFAVATMLMSLTVTSIFHGSLWQRMIPATIVHLGFNTILNSMENNGTPLATSPITVTAAATMLAAAIAVSTLLRRISAAQRL